MTETRNGLPPLQPIPTIAKVALTDLQQTASEQDCDDLPIGIPLSRADPPVTKRQAVNLIAGEGRHQTRG